MKLSLLINTKFYYSDPPPDIGYEKRSAGNRPRRKKNGSKK